MKKNIKRFFSLFLALVIAFSFTTAAFAADDENTGEPYSAEAHIVDGICGIIHDVVLGTLQDAARMRNIPELEEFTANNNYYYGTDGKVTGTGWKGGFASDSIIPDEWRADKNFLSDENGWCFTLPPRVIGGYPGVVINRYTDQMMNMFILSNGSDSNSNGVEDIIIFASVDGIGVTALSCVSLRESAEKALAAKGVERGDILSFNISASHCHGALDTQGMAVQMILLKLMNVFLKFSSNKRILSVEMQNSLDESAYKCASEAYSKIEDGRLYFFESEKVSSHDKNESGVKIKNTFSCFLFEGKSEKTIISNIGAHPTSYTEASYGKDDTFMMCADYPYFMTLALREAGYNLVFTQSAQAAVSSPDIDCAEDSQLQKDADAWAQSHTLSKEEWIERYGKDYTEKYYDEREPDFENYYKKGYKLARQIIDAIDKTNEVAPVLNVSNNQTVLPLDNNLLTLGAVTGLLGENVVKMKGAESGYGAVAEINYIEIGNDVSIFTAPGELSPALVYGTDPDYTGTALWKGPTSWAGKDWEYDTLENLVRKYTGDEDKTVLLFGITNDALGYIYPDICTTKSILGAARYYKERKGIYNDMMLTTGQHAGSSIMKGFINALEDIKE